MTAKDGIVSLCVSMVCSGRNGDWEAYYAEDEDDDYKPIGKGATEQAAIDDLKTRFPRKE